jgi:hypothetical protein
MRTIQQQTQETAMLTEISEIVNGSRATLIEDAVGVLSLFVMLYAGLTLSGAF